MTILFRLNLATVRTNSVSVPGNLIDGVGHRGLLDGQRGLIFRSTIESSGSVPHADFLGR